MFKKNKIIDSGRESVKIEIDGLNSILNNSINDNFVNLVNLILKNNGRVFLSAVGKPGYIARKVAATLSSTGTPSFFIHPDEASHGDLGMITKNDIVILLSNSGGSNELNDIIAYCKRFSIKLIGITRKQDSFLAKSADLPIVLENIRQTNNVNSPTTDIIMFLSYLDAVCTVLIDLKGFTNEKFKIFHPGGKLGKSLIKVCDIMRTGNSIPEINFNDNMENAIKEISLKSVGSVCVTDNNKKLIGIISDGDLRRKTIEYGNILNKNIVDIMTKTPISIKKDNFAVEAVNKMTENDKYIQVLPVIDEDNNIVGILHIQDLFKANVI